MIEIKYSPDSVICPPDHEKVVLQISDTEEQWTQQTSEGTAYGFRTKQPNGIWHETIWLPRTPRLGRAVSNTSLMERYPQFRGQIADALFLDDQGHRYKNTQGWNGEPQVMFRIQRTPLTAIIETSVS